MSLCRHVNVPIRKRGIFMKKLIAAALALIMLVPLTGCGLSKLTNKGKADADATVSAAADSKLTRGTWQNGSYTNDYVSFTFTPPENWVVSTDEELADLMGADVGEAGEDLSGVDIVYDTLVQDPDSFDNVFIMYENVNIFGGAIASTQAIMDEIVSQMEDSNDGTKYTHIGNAEYAIGSDKYLCAEFDVEVSGISFKQYVLLHKLGRFIANITITDVTGASLDYYLGMFS